MRVSKETFDKIKKRAERLDSEFDGFRKKGAEIQQYVCPWRGRFLTGESENEDRGEMFNDKSIHNTMIFQAVQTAAAGIKSGISPSSRPWFRIGSEDKRLAELGAPARWLSYVERLIYSIFQRSNVYDALQEVATEILVFGTGAAAVLPDYDTVTRMRTFTFGEYRLANDHRRISNTFARKFYMTVDQLVKEFGEEHVTDRTKKAYRDGNLETKILVRCLIESNDDRLDVKDALGRDWRSIYWEHGSTEDSVLCVRGFEEFPVISSTWEAVGGQVYGIGAGHLNLRNGKRLQKLEEDSLQQLALQNKPPLLANTSNKDTIINAGPWGITRSNDASGSGQPGIAPLYQVRPNTQELEFKIERVEKAIREGFYNHIFLMIAGNAADIKTAYQAARMMEEKYSVLGPVIERMQKMLGQLIQITFAHALDAGLIPEAPRELQGSELKIEYISILAQAQKIAGLQAISETMAFVSTASQIWPEARFKIDALQAVDEVAQVNGAPPSIIRSDDEVQAMMDQEAKQKASQQTGQSALMAAEGAQKLKDVEIGGQPAVDVLAKTMGAGR